MRCWRDRHIYPSSFHLAWSHRDCSVLADHNPQFLTFMFQKELRSCPSGWGKDVKKILSNIKLAYVLLYHLNFFLEQRRAVKKLKKKLTGIFVLSSAFCSVSTYYELLKGMLSKWKFRCGCVDIHKPSMMWLWLIAIS